MAFALFVAPRKRIVCISCAVATCVTPHDPGEEAAARPRPARRIPQPDRHDLRRAERILSSILNQQVRFIIIGLHVRAGDGPPRCFVCIFSSLGWSSFLFYFLFR